MTAYESTTSRLQPHPERACALVEDLLPLYIDGEVNPSTRDYLDEHLAHCDHCAGYLAGSRSARLQLRQEQVARVQVLQRDQPAQRVIVGWQQFLRSLLELTAYGMAVPISAALWVEQPRFTQSLGMMMAVVCFFVLSGLVHKSGSLTLGRLLKVGIVCLVGSVGATSLLPPAEMPLPFFGALFIIVSFAALRHLLAEPLSVARSQGSHR